jgi:hypothetical protein
LFFVPQVLRIWNIFFFVLVISVQAILIPVKKTLHKKGGGLSCADKLPTDSRTARIRRQDGAQEEDP